MKFFQSADAIGWSYDLWFWVADATELNVYPFFQNYRLKFWSLNFTKMKYVVDLLESGLGRYELKYVNMIFVAR